ncbi:MAG: 3-methyl-2-oxobutanoate hydroxymethyltransferase [Candidatus Melainabacteria bacterium]|jgi:3-methyl-2-oxobutanoate hydroxymethyltransferase|nr:3-methyl-2-oxobutanoate hydroxymethyltransferase [Candidatus Melainabacteria bacterium]
MSGKITMLTAYDYNTARALAEVDIDYILVGDSLAMVALGYPNTQTVSLGEILIATRAVRRGAPKSKIITDMPLQAVNKKINEALRAAEQIVIAGANIVKVENAEKETLRLIRKLRDERIEVMGHLGYTPQTLEKPILVKDKERLLDEAQKLEEHGVMALVLEMVPSEIATEITQAIKIPTIGIGAGAGCSGQVLVSDDMLGRYNLMQPKFLRRYSNQYEDMLSSFKKYIEDVKGGDFPAEAESY